MNVAEKIYYTWMILIIPISLCWWMLFDVREEKHPILSNFMYAFMGLPIAIGLITIVVLAILQVWQE